MSQETARAKDTIEQAVARSISNEMNASAQRLNLLRLATVGVFFAIQFIGGVLINHPDLQMDMQWFAYYWVIAIVIYVLGRNYTKYLSVLRYSVPFIDIPMCLAILWSAAGSGSARGTAGFGAGIFALMIVIAALGLHRRVIIMAALSAAICEDWLQTMVGVSGPARLAAIGLMGLVAAGCVFLVGRLKELTISIASEQVQSERMSRYFSPQITEVLRSDRPETTQSQTQEITVLFCDIRGFTAMTEELGGPQIVELLNRYFTAMVDIVFNHDGTLDKFMGDAILAYFGAPFPSDDHAERGIRCAVAMQKRLEELNQDAIHNGLKELKIVVAVHTGKAVLGNIGSEKRREYTAIGEAVNTAARMESLAKEQNASILVSQSSKNQATTLFNFRELAPQKLRGINQPLRCYSLIRNKQS